MADSINNTDEAWDIIATAYFDSDIERKYPGSGFSFWTTDNFCERKINLLRTSADDIAGAYAAEIEFIRHYPNAELVGFLTKGGLLVISEANETQILNPKGPSLDLTKVKDGPVTRNPKDPSALVPEKLTYRGIIAHAYFDPRTNDLMPGSTVAFGLRRQFTEFTYKANVLMKNPGDSEAFKRLYPDAQFRGLITDEGSLIVNMDGTNYKMPIFGPLLDRTNIQDGPIRRVPRLSPSERAAAMGLRVIVSGPRLEAPHGK